MVEPYLAQRGDIFSHTPLQDFVIFVRKMVSSLVNYDTNKKIVGPKMFEGPSDRSSKSRQW